MKVNGERRGSNSPVLSGGDKKAELDTYSMVEEEERRIARRLEGSDVGKGIQKREREEKERENPLSPSIRLRVVANTTGKQMKQNNRTGRKLTGSRLVRPLTASTTLSLGGAKVSTGGRGSSSGSSGLHTDSKETDKNC